MIKTFNIEEIFDLKSGDFHATKELDDGEVPLISCGDYHNGLVGYYDIPPANRYSNTITVAYNGQPLTAKFHPYSFGAKDDVAVLLPKSELQDKTLIYIASLFNHKSWRYSYGRKCFKAKLSQFNLDLPVNNEDEIDELYIDSLFPQVKNYLPPKNDVIEDELGQDIKWEVFNVAELFDFKRGDFHSLAALDEGEVPTVARLSHSNGIVGYFTPPENAQIYEKGLITVSTVTGDAFVQLADFMATDNVVICIPKEPLKITSLFFVQLMLNRAKWRYSYGRQCYKTKFTQTNIYLPVDENEEIDEELMKKYITNTSYWSFISENVDFAG